jgi:hypothetical protein
MDHARDEAPLFPRHSLSLRVGDEIVEFMDGHRERELVEVRAQIITWLNRTRAA